MRDNLKSTVQLDHLLQVKWLEMTVDVRWTTDCFTSKVIKARRNDQDSKIEHSYS